MSGFFALLDDIATLAKLTLSTVDDTASMAVKASAKVSAAAVDDVATTPQYVTGITPDRELPIIKKITIYYRNGETEELQFDKRDNPMIYETKDFVRLIKEHKVDHQFLRASEIEMDITDEVRRQTGIVFPADKIREQ